MTQRSITKDSNLQICNAFTVHVIEKLQCMTEQNLSNKIENNTEHSDNEKEHTSLLWSQFAVTGCKEIIL